MRSWNQATFANPDLETYLEPEEVESGWLGFPGATETQIQRAEQRLGVTFPPSYREFLSFTNGWKLLNFTVEHVYSTEEIEWFSVHNQRTIDAWMQNSQSLYIPDEIHFIYGDTQAEHTLRVEYLQSCLHISNTSEDGVDLLLNPKVISPNGEWEAWLLAHWLPGAKRYRSFWELMQAEYQRGSR